MREYGDPSPGTLASWRAGCPFLPGENGGLGNQHPVRRAATRALGDPVFSGAKECGGAAGTPKWGHHRPEPRGKEESGSGRAQAAEGKTLLREEVAEKVLWPPPFPKRGCPGTVGTVSGQALRRGGRLSLWSVRGRCSQRGGKELGDLQTSPAAARGHPVPPPWAALAFALGVPSLDLKKNPLSLGIAVSDFCDFQSSPRCPPLLWGLAGDTPGPELLPRPCLARSAELADFASLIFLLELFRNWSPGGSAGQRAFVRRRAGEGRAPGGRELGDPRRPGC